MENKSNDFEKYALLWLRYLFAVHLLLSGVNYYIPIVPPPAITVSPSWTFIEAMMNVGMYDFIKIVEILAALMLIFNVMVPTALVLEFPITVAIFYLDVFVDHKPRQIYAGSKELILNGLLMLAYWRYYLPMLSIITKPAPIWATKK